MDVPPIQYTQTEDGLSIAYWVAGSGPPLIHDMMPATSHLEMEWRLPSLRAWYEHLAERFTVVRFDHRGRGLSDPDLSDLSVAAHVRDIEAVADAVGHDQFALLGTMHTGPPAIAFAVDQPVRVSGLLLLNTYASSVDEQAGYEGAIAMSRASHAVWASAIARVISGNSAIEPALVELLEGAATPTAVQAMLTAFRAYDVSDLLPQLDVPVLVIHSRDSELMPLSLGRTLASRIPEAKLVVLEGDGYPFLTGNEQDTAIQAINDFMSTRAALTDVTASHGAFRTILFTDVEASTALTDRFGDAKARDLLREHERLTRDALAAHGGTEIKTMGDGFMASFTSASSALDAAIAMQQAIAAHFAERETPIRIRVGINAGEPIEEDADLYGASVIRAARVMGQADGGEILVTDVVRQLVEGKEYLFGQRGEVDLKGFEEAVRLFEVRWRDDA